MLCALFLLSNNPDELPGGIDKRLAALAAELGLEAPPEPGLVDNRDPATRSPFAKLIERQLDELSECLQDPATDPLANSYAPG